MSNMFSKSVPKNVTSLYEKQWTGRNDRDWFQAKF